MWCIEPKGRSHPWSFSKCRPRFDVDMKRSGHRLGIFNNTQQFFAVSSFTPQVTVDTILVVMLTEIISKWFPEAHFDQWLTLGGNIVGIGHYPGGRRSMVPDEMRECPRILPT